MKDYKYEKVYQRIINDINQGYYKYLDKLPSIRKMADSLEVSRTTVESAYFQLMIEGYITAKEKVGYFVDVQDVYNNDNNANGNNTIESQPVHYRYDFSGRQVDSESFNIEIWKKYIKKALNFSDDMISYGDPSGENILKQQLQSYCRDNRGVIRPIDNYLVGAGFQVLLQHVCALFGKDSVVAIEETGFKQAEAVFRDCHMNVVKSPVDDLGISVNELKKYPIKLLYLNSSSGGYHGHPIKQQRRNELIRYAKENDVYIIEDDHNGELKFNTKPIDAMAKLDDQRIIYLGSFSKLLLPSIRISYLIMPKLLNNLSKQIISDYHPTTSKLEQIALALYIEDGQLLRHLKRLRKHYYNKGNYLLQQLQLAFPNNRFELYETSLKITMEVADNKIDDYITLAKNNNILVTKNSNNEITLSISGILTEDIDPSIKILKNIWK